MFLTLNIHNRISNYFASFSAVFARKYLFVSLECKSPETATAVLLLEIARKEKGGNPGFV